MPATEGFGAQLGYAELGQGTYADIAQTVDLGLPSSTVGAIEIVHNDLPGGVKQFKAGLISPEEYEFSVIYDKAAAADLYALKASRATKSWRLSIPDGSSMTFDGFVVGLGGESETDDGLFNCSVTIQQSGTETFTAAA